MDRKGFSAIIVILIIVIIVVVIGFFSYLHQAPISPSQNLSPQQNTPTNNTSSTIPGWQTYTNTAAGLSFQYPSDWTLTEDPQSSSSITQGWFLFIDLGSKDGKEGLQIQGHIQNPSQSFDDYVSQQLGSSTPNGGQMTPISIAGHEGVQYNAVMNSALTDLINQSPSRYLTIIFFGQSQSTDTAIVNSIKFYP